MTGPPCRERQGYRPDGRGIDPVARDLDAVARGSDPVERRNMRRFRIIGVIAVLVLVAAACDGGGETASDTPA